MSRVQLLRGSVLLAVLAAVVLQDVRASGAAETGGTVKDPRGSWKLLVFGAEAEIEGAFGVALVEKLGQCSRHEFSPEEKKSYSAYLLEQERARREASLVELRRKIDELELLKKTTELEAARLEYAAIETGIAGLTAEQAADGKPVEIVRTSSPEPAEPGDLRSSADAVLSYGIEVLGDAYLLSVRFRPLFEERETEEIILSFTGKEIDLAAQEVCDRLKVHILGRSWAALELETAGASPVSDAPVRLNLFLDGERIGEKERETLLPGSYVFTVHAPGYQARELQLFLAPGARRTVRVPLVPIPRELVTITGGPAGTPVYLDGRYTGSTPLSIEVPVLPSLVELNREGYRKQTFTLPAGDGGISYSLEPERYDRRQLVDSKRRTFYNSFGVFLLSIPVSMISYGIGMEYALAANDAVSGGAAGEEVERLVEQNGLWYTAYLGSLFANFFLAANALINLSDYLDMHETVNGIGRK